MAAPSLRRPGARATPWLIGGVAVLAVVMGFVVAIVTQADDAEDEAAPGPSPSTVAPTEAPTESPTIEPTTDPTAEPWPGLAFDPDLPTQTFPVEEGRACRDGDRCARVGSDQCCRE